MSKTDGVPLFVEELTKSILESSGLKDAGDHYTYFADARALAIPHSLRDSLMSRLDRLMLVKEIAQIGAVIGHSFNYELIAAVAPHAKPELDQALGQLTASGLAFRQGMPPDAAYSFKHALVRDAAYGSLLKSRRQELHGKIARVIEERYPATADTEPELLAHHYTEARQFEKAIPHWHKAGKLARKRMALAEAIRHLGKGLDLSRDLPESTERDGLELDLRILLGSTWMAFRGWPAPQVWDSLHPALALAHLLRRSDALLPILWGLCIHVLTSGRIAESLQWVTQLEKAAEDYHDSDLTIAWHTAALGSYFYLGDLFKIREHADQALALYEEARPDHLAALLVNDSRTFSLSFLARQTWMLGYPDQAVKISDTKDSYARQLGQPVDLGFALTVGARVLDYLTDAEETLRRVCEAERLGREHSLPLFAEYLVPVSFGMALIRKGDLASGIASLRTGLAVWERSGGRVCVPQYKSVLAEGVAQLGDLEGALNLVDESIAQIERPGWEEREYYAETLRIKGWLLSLKGDVEGAEHNYLASLDWARHQQAKSWELRTALSYARLMRDQGRTKEACELLAPIYGWFTEGFGTKDLKDARALLEELAADQGAAPALAAGSS